MQKDSTASSDSGRKTAADPVVVNDVHCAPSARGGGVGVCGDGGGGSDGGGGCLGSVSVQEGSDNFDELNFKNFLDGGNKCLGKICEWVIECYRQQGIEFAEIDEPDMLLSKYQYDHERVKRKLEVLDGKKSYVVDKYQMAVNDCVNLFQKKNTDNQGPSMESDAQPLERFLEQLKPGVGVEGGGGGVGRGVGGGGGGGGTGSEGGGRARGINYLQMLETFQFFLQHDLLEVDAKNDTYGRCIFEQVKYKRCNIQFIL